MDVPSEVTNERCASTTQTGRIMFSRDELVELRDDPSLHGMFEQLAIALLPAYSRTKLAKAKSKTSKVIPNEKRTGNISSGLVLGPQKCTWNIGCRVSQPKKGVNEQDTHSQNKFYKGMTDSRFVDKPVTRTQESKRDSRSNIWYMSTSGRVKDKGQNRNSQAISFFSRNYGNPKSDETNHEHGRSRYEPEPEWFSGGPETVHDTIELGGIIDDVNDSVSAEDLPLKLPKTVNCVPAITVEDNAIVSVESKRNCEGSHPATTPVELDFLVSSIESSQTATNGSRLKHLFKKPDSDVSNRESQLLKLLRSQDSNASTVLESARRNDPLTTKPIPAPATIASPSANDLESALRSLILGTAPITSEAKSFVRTNTVANTPPKRPLTLQEIEADLRSAAPYTPRDRSSCISNSAINTSAYSKLNAVDYSGPGSCGAPFLQSLVNQPSFRQEGVPFYASQARNSYTAVGPPTTILQTNVLHTRKAGSQYQPEDPQHLFPNLRTSYPVQNPAKVYWPTSSIKGPCAPEHSMNWSCSNTTCNSAGVDRFTGDRMGFGLRMDHSSYVNGQANAAASAEPVFQSHMPRPIVKSHNMETSLANCQHLPGFGEPGNMASLSASSFLPQSVHSQRELESRLLLQLKLKNQLLCRNSAGDLRTHGATPQPLMTTTGERSYQSFTGSISTSMLFPSTSTMPSDLRNLRAPGFPVSANSMYSIDPRLSMLQQSFNSRVINQSGLQPHGTSDPALLQARTLEQVECMAMKKGV